jgi:RNA polymerase sigma factor (TIGR02999 family)
MRDADSTDRITNLLLDWSKGDRNALDQLLPLIYSELRRMAASRLKWERKDHTLQPTALVHEAYLRMVNQRESNWKNRAHFFALASEIMRRILVNHARDRAAAKRGGHAQRISLSIAEESLKQNNVDVVALDLALNKLALQDSRKSRVVELKFFGGLTTEEIAEILQISHATVEREWTLSRAWLYREIAGGKSALPE